LTSAILAGKYKTRSESGKAEYERKHATLAQSLLSSPNCDFN
jgi:hypothetical protein